MRHLMLLIALLLGSAQESFATGIIASRTLKVGTVLTHTDLQVEPGSPDSAGEAGDLLAAMVGREVRRAIYIGRRVLPEYLGPPTLVRRNDVVTMIYSAGNLGLRTQGRSLGAGGLGELIDVMNLDTRTTVRGRVVGAQTIEAAK